MLRALVYFFMIAALALGAAFVADIPGEVVIQLPTHEVRMHLAVAAGIVVVLSVLTITVYRIISTFVEAPAEFFRWRASGRRRRGFTAITRGLVAVAAGDEEEARRQTKKAISLVGEPPLAMLLAAQAAQLDGDDDAAQRYFTQMLQSKETEFLGLRGLYVAATRRGDTEQAINIANRALTLRPRTRWALNALFDLSNAKGDWNASATALDGQVRAKLLDTGIARDTPGFAGEPKEKLGSGPSILVYDGGMIPNVKLRHFVQSTADKMKVKYHLTSMRGGTTDGSRIHMSRVGVPCVVIGPAVRYIHGHNAIMSRSDYEASVKLVVELVKRLDAKTVKSFTQA